MIDTLSYWCGLITLTCMMVLGVVVLLLMVVAVVAVCGVGVAGEHVDRYRVAEYGYKG